MTAMGLMGYSYSCPDMIGGGNIDSLGPDTNLANIDQELVVRMAQVHALMPMMQFSAAPWRILGTNELAAVKKVADLHTDFGPVFLELAQLSSVTREPIIRTMEYNWPGQGYESIIDQFALGEDILVAPITHEGTYSRSVHFPPGTWQGDDGSIVVGPCEQTISVPLDRLPWYELIPGDLGIFEASDDVGAVGLSGAAHHDAGEYRVQGAGSDIWDSADSFHFLHAAITGNCTLEARVASVPTIHEWAKAGVMIRETTDAGSRFVLLAQRPDKQVSMQFRSATDSAAEAVGALSGGTAVVKHLRLVRDGDLFSGWYSTDGSTWTLLGQQTVTMNSPCSAGLFFTSHDSSTSGTALFDQVSLQPMADADSDGMADSWERDQFATTTASDGSGDFDGDGFADGSEYLAGTEANDASSLLAITELAEEQLHWQSVDGKTYALWSADSLTGTWELVEDSIVATNSSAAWPVATDTDQSFFRIEVQTAP